MRNVYFDRKMVLLYLLAILLGLALVFQGPTGTLDSRLYYSAQTSSQYMNSLSLAQISIYFRNELVDLALIGTYTTISILSLKRLWPRPTGIRFLGLLPGLLDLIETLVILFCLAGQTSISRFPWLGDVTFAKCAKLGFKSSHFPRFTGGHYQREIPGFDSARRTLLN